jgi:ubiquinone/menaquinone biosynthesis C-methylase UbiE
MAQITSGIRSILSHPFVYQFFQELMGARSMRRTFSNEYIRAQPGIKVLDIGCGPAHILEHLSPKVQYWGFDISKQYINFARSRHGSRGHFHSKSFEEGDLAILPPMDVAVATGLFHHLDNKTAIELLGLVHRALKPTGRLVTLDGVFAKGQNPIARWLISKDRGQHVRTGPEYSALFAKFFSNSEVRIWHRRWLPYTYCLTECRKSSHPVEAPR